MKDKSNKNSLVDNRLPKEGVYSVPTRPQKPRDGYGFGGGMFTPGVAPYGGYQAIWNFNGKKDDYKNSPVSKPDKRS